MAKENDVVLIYLEDQPISFARIEDISPDVKKDWYHVKILMLQLPLQVATWILRDIYINGQEFTMGGKRMRLEPVVCPKSPDPSADKSEKPEKPDNGKVISLLDLKKNKD
ncbi:MAG: hypothetical protein JRF31_07600 [Deltaproteobacteria bacterium]|jgi:hypothetical protein|nr:hypothetical protein [Deltaproteobacteria bacterium]MBW1957198.1 hypothetical protein [Deltaproteobacteria bacterium]MBW2013416.1 hypothetical protein [Deltaproteobacteria bacterium]MBW2088387.1 hypothetical protein [Deltaproteobacteria bacterium]MBW2320698.1 hypothetical protein [Deltaproteobacteria bacterium]